MLAHGAEKNGTHPETVQQERDLMDLVKGNGPWQWMIIAVVIAASFPSGSNNMAMAFMAPNVDHWCARPPGINMSLQEWKETALPRSDMMCFRYSSINNSSTSVNNSFTRPTVACDSWEYDHSIYISTIVSQWNLVCDRAWLVSISKSIFVTGYILSCTIFAYLADRYGRKPLILACNILAIMSGISLLFSTSFLMFVVSRFFVAAGVTGCDHFATILLLEIVGPKYRANYYVVIGFGWLMGVCHLPIIAWLLRDWVSMEIIILMPSVFLLFVWWLLPESPRWLLTHGKTSESLKILSKAAKANGVNISDNKLKEMVTNLKEPEEYEKPKTGILQLFRPELRSKTLVMWFIWCVTAFVYYGIAYNTNEMSGDPFVNFTIYNITDAPAALLVLALMHFKGRRTALITALFCAGVSSLLVYFIPEDLSWMQIGVSVLGKFCISGTFTVLGLFTTEIFPTVLRNIGVGSASGVARIGAILAPFVRELGRAHHPLIPQLLFGVLSISAGGLALLLPETSNCSIPDTVKEAAQISKKKYSDKHPENTWILKNFTETEETEFLLDSS